MIQPAPLTSSPPPGVAAIYVRLSQDREGKGEAVARQEADCRPLCERRGYRADRIRIYSDNDLSAYSGADRPAYRNLLKDIEAGEVTFIAAWHHDRLQRSMRDTADFITLIQRTGVEVETARAGTLDLLTPSGRMTAYNLGNIARYESEHKSERHKAAEVSLALAGKSHGGRRPFGFEADRVEIRPAEAELVREAARRALEGESLYAITEDWAKRGIVTPTYQRRRDGEQIGANPWTITKLRKLLLSGRIAGQREHLGRVVAKAKWDAIISEEDSARLLSRISHRNLRGAGTGNRPSRYLLSGIAVCGLCGERLVARPRRGGVRAMACASDLGRGCGRVTVVADPLEALVAEAVMQSIDGGSLAALIAEEQKENATTLSEDLVAVDAKMAELATMFGHGEITSVEWRAAREPLDRQRRELVGGLEALQQRLHIEGIPDPLRAAWPTMGFAQRRVAIEAVVACVVVGSAVRGVPKFSPDRVAIEWKV